ncbi:hypothetical protein [Arthrobacter castelli]|uniref:hypothetical protein n=1 Tax=Arthrobacter castelli TaxID=271431 RepID=UPI0003FEB8B9|nr:hypothetical protein [Arthrobacter castelli]
MGIKDKALAVGKTFRLTSHHAIERFGVFFGALVLGGALVLSMSGASAFMAGRDTLRDTALWTPDFTTSKTDLSGEVDGVYTNAAGNQALVMMHFDDGAQISYNAADYQAFLLGSDERLDSEKLDTAGIEGSFHVFGSTGYVAVLLTADEPFKQQVLNLTVRANAELSLKQQQADGQDAQELASDETFAKYDQWRVFINPGATGAKELSALNGDDFKPAQVYYQIVLKPEEQQARQELNSKLLAMRTNLAQIKAYSNDLLTTQVDGLSLRAPEVPDSIAGDQITGQSAAESKNGQSTLALQTDTVVAGGFGFSWRNNNVYDGYLDELVPEDQSYVRHLSQKTQQSSTSDDTSSGVGGMEWILSDGSNLTTDYGASDAAMQPLINVMNNLSQAYQDYYSNKSQYQSSLKLELLHLDMELRDVQANSSSNSGDDFLVTFD